MKIQSITAILAILACTPLAQAQTVSSTAPVVPAQNVTSSSPIGNGRVVTNYYGGQQATPVRLVSQTGTTVSYQPLSTPPAAATAPSLSPTPYYGNTTTGTPIVTTAGSGTCQCTPRAATVSYAPQAAYYPVANQVVAPQAVRYPNQTVYQPVSGYGAGYQNGVYVGRGLLGQPKAYVNRQPLRNFFRYITP